MVRVLSIHNFESQTIETCEDPVAVTSAPPDRLLVALSHHMIEVHDLSPERKPVFSFPTVDQVCSLIHCITGNYVATMEVKVGRENREVVYTRIYANWDKPELLNSSQPTAMRARIAGRVTPSSSQTGGETLEMIELPVRFPNTSAIACCQATGNLIVGSGKTVCLFQLVSRLHDISRQRFFDFELWPVTLELNFAPTDLSIVENIVAAMDKQSQSVHVFKINKGVSHRSGQSSTYSGSPLRTNSAASGTSSEKKVATSSSDQEPLDIDKLISEVEIHSNSSVLQVVDLPTVKLNNLSCDLRPSPFKPSYMVSMGVAIKEMPTNEPWAEQMTTMVESLLQLEIEDCNEDILHSLILRPLYLQSNFYDSNDKVGTSTASSSHSEWSCPRLRSVHYNRLVGLDCLICTQQEGFLYHFSVGNFDMINVGECITVYSFTSPLHHVCMEAGIIHALTTSGLETYTMRSTHAVHLDDNQVCPPIDDPICLIGLRPFIGIVGLLLTEFHLIILASEMKSTTWTIYSLKLPSPEQLYRDMVSIASTYKASTPPMYRQLLGEAHIIIRTATQLSASPVSCVNVSSESKEMFKQSCALLAQSHLMSEKEVDWEIGTKYVAMSGMSPDAYLSWLGMADNQVNFDLNRMVGLSHYLMKCLGQWPDRLSHSIVTALSDQLEPVQLAELLLKSPALVSCASDSVRQKLLRRTEPECCLASELLAKDPGSSLQMLPDDKETNDKLVKILIQNYTLLFDSMRMPNSQVMDDVGNKMKLMTFSELSVLLMQEKPYQLASCLASLVSENNKLDMEHILQIFMTYLPSRIGLAGASASGAVVLQLFLEEVLLFGNEKLDTSQPPVQDALKILMRSYLSDLKCQCSKEYNSDKLKVSELPTFLNELPSNGFETNPSTKKLQWLLYKGWLDTKALSELNQFVYDFLPNCLTLQVLAQPPDAAIQLLLDNAPHAVIVYSKEMIKENNDWHMLLKQLKDRSDKEVQDSIYATLLKELLSWLSENGKLCNILQQDDSTDEEFKEYVLTCQQVRHAEHIHCLIRATGEHLLTTLNL